MAVTLRKAFCVSCSSVAGLNKKKPLAGEPASSSEFSPWKSEFRAKQVVLGGSQPGHGHDGWALSDHAVHARETSVCIPRSMRWWEKGAAPNMIEISSAQELVDSLLNAGDRLVVINFYSPSCGGCKALHPKICQFVDSNPDVLFLKVNYEEHKSMCYSLNVRVLPFFRFCRGAQGRIKKFKDAMAIHGPERRNTGPAKGLEESELLKLASNGLLQFYPTLVSPGNNDLADNFSGSLGGGAAEAEDGMAALAR